MHTVIICHIILAVLYGLSATSFAAPASTVIREEQKMAVDGILETWRLEWSASPKPACSFDDPAWYTCPCMGFAFGETGSLTLVRIRPGRNEERLQLDSYFSMNDFAPESSADGKAILQKWKPVDGDMENFEKPGFAQELAKRPVVRMIQFGDYNHDGRATEFLLQIGTLPCGKPMSIAVGVSKSLDRLHVISSKNSPEKPLVLQAQQWQALKSSKTGTAKVVDWQCGDHGSENQEELELKASKGVISAIRQRYECTENVKGKLLESTPF